MRITSFRLRTGEREGQRDGEDGPVDDDGALLDDAAGADDDGPGDGEDGRLGVDDGPCAELSVGGDLGGGRTCLRRW